MRSISLSRAVALVSLVSWVGIVSATVSDCCRVRSKMCCDVQGVTADVLNTTRTCGILNDQDCPDRITANASVNVAVCEFESGKMDAEDITGSKNCTVKYGACDGSWGNNLCGYTVTTLTCTPQKTSGDSCGGAGSAEPF